MAITQTTNNIPEDGKPSKPKITAKVTVSPAPDEFVTPPPKQHRVLNPTPAKPSKLDDCIAKFISDRHTDEMGVCTACEAKSEIKALIEEVIGPDEYEVGDHDKSAQQKAVDNELRAEMRLRKDAL